MNVIKRNGQTEILSFDKITNRVKLLSPGLSLNPTEIAKHICGMVFDNIKTADIDDAIATFCASKVVENPDYQTLASRIVVNSHTKNTTTFMKTTRQLYTAGKLSDEYFENVNWLIDLIEDAIDYQRDYLIDYFGFKTLEKSYLMKAAGDKVVERPQHLWMRVAVHLHKTDFVKVKLTYDLLSTKMMSHATPTLFNSGGLNANLSSCFLLGMDDSLEGIFDCVTDCAKISKWAGGLGVGMSNIRSKGSLIHGTGGESSGIIPMLKLFDATGRFINQGGKRMGSIACYLEPHHDDIFDFLNAKKHIGNDEDRARNLFYGLWVSDLFMKRVKADMMWSLFSPQDVPHFVELYGDKYEEAYLDAEHKKMYRRQVSARSIWDEIIKSQIETGGPYLLYKDSVNRKNNQMNIGIIKNSNLCAEITEVSDQYHTSNCNLASVCLPSFVVDGQFDFEAMGKVVEVMVENLNIIIDINNYPTEKARRTNLAHRPIGIGVQGLADVFMKMGMAFDSQEARDLNLKIFENLYYYAMKKSISLAKEDGGYEFCKGSPLSEGKFQFDLWDVTPKYVDFAPLRADVIKYGAKNSLLIALMPTASTSQIFGFSSCFEPIVSNMYVRRTLAGEYTLINHYLVDELKTLGMDTPKMMNRIIENNGSVQSIREIPSYIRDKYKTAYEIKQKVIIDLAADRAPYICQSQSMNLFFENANYLALSSAHFYGWSRGLKTGSYYIRTKSAIRAQKILPTQRPSGKTEDSQENEECLMCVA
jgi:ribonucleoside-diphosphate reductase alpha chain